MSVFVTVLLNWNSELKSIYQYCKLRYRILFYRRYQTSPIRIESSSIRIRDWSRRLQFYPSKPITRSINLQKFIFSTVIHLINTITACCHTTTTWPRQRQRRRDDYCSRMYCTCFIISLGARRSFYSWWCSGTFAVDHEAVLAAVDAAMITEGGFHNVRDRCKLLLLLLTSK